MPELEEARLRAKATYNAAADRYDDAANSFWARYGRRSVERIRLGPGSEVLDVCCGSGASALVAAEEVGPTGRVLGVDLAQGMLALAQEKARAKGLRNVEFRVGDLIGLDVPDESFDAVICVFGIFFVPDMMAAARSLWSKVRPGGKLAITTWGPRFFEPAISAFWSAVREVRPDLYRGYNPWDRLCDPLALNRVLEGAGISGAEIIAEPGEHPIPTPESWWAAILGSGYRGTYDALDTEARERVKQANFAYVRGSGIRCVEANVVYAIAVKMGPANR